MTFALAFALAGTVVHPRAEAADDIPDRDAVEIAFDRQKGKIHAAYLKALHQQPEIKGRIDFAFTLETDGSASRCRVVRSELGAPALEAELCKIVEGMTFVPRKVPVSITKPIHFFPASAS